MASEVAALEKKRHGGNSKSSKGAAAGVPTNAHSTQTDTYTAELPSASQQLIDELSMLQAELQRRDQALAAAHASHSELRAAHDRALRCALDAEPVQAENARLIEEARQAHSDAEADQQLKKKLTQQVEDITLELNHLQSQHSELQSQHTCLQATAQSLQASETACKAELQSMTQSAEAAQSCCSRFEAVNLKSAQQLEDLQTRSSQLEQTQEQLQVFIANAAQQVPADLLETTAADSTNLLSAARALIDSMQRRWEKAEAEAVELTQQLQDAQAARALEVEQLRYGSLDVGAQSLGNKHHFSCSITTRPCLTLSLLNCLYGSRLCNDLNSGRCHSSHRCCCRQLLSGPITTYLLFCKHWQTLSSSTTCLPMTAAKLLRLLSAILLATAVEVITSLFTGHCCPAHQNCAGVHCRRLSSSQLLLLFCQSLPS